ncbi:hypothetical protein C8J56DRAFT_798510, partial [Mycena floridula]
PHLLMAYSSEAGDMVQLAKLIERNIRLYQIRNNYVVRPSAASWIHRSLVQSIQSPKPYNVSLLLGGYETATLTTPLLYGYLSFDAAGCFSGDFYHFACGLLFYLH